MSFKRIKEENIEQAESFVQNELKELLEAKCIRNNIILNETEYSYFFGSHTNNPEKFCFLDDEKNLIQTLVQHVADKFASEDISDALARFAIDEHSNSIIYTTTQDWFFSGKCEQPINQQLEETNLDETRITQPVTRAHYFLNRLLETANKNAFRSENGYRYDQDIKNFAVYFRMLAGPLAYNTIQRNLTAALPSLSTTNRSIQQSNENITEGVLRCEELLIYLQERNLPLFVALSEDATRIEGKVQFDARTNQVVGFVLPINEQNGLPIPFSYKARSAVEITEHFSTGIQTASFVYTIMAKPIGDAPAFCLIIFGSDSKFSAQNVATRWKYIREELKKLGIVTLTFASDSDPKFNCAMRKNSSLGCVSSYFPKSEWFSCGNSIEPPFYIQDVIHIATKMRNWALKSLIHPEKFPFGDKYFIRLDQLHFLKDHFPKDQHRLTRTALNPVDRQNFESVLKLCDSAVIDLLKKHVKNSEATVMFLNLLKNYIDSYLSISLSPLEKVQKIWYSMFIVRIWRKYVLKNKSLSLKNNFLTSNCYTCMEQNAHSLVLLLLFLKEKNMPQLFKTNLIDSQPCESFYRQLRSFSSTYSTVANCTVKEIMSRISKIHLQNKINNGMESGFVFPKKLKSSTSSAVNEIILPSKEEIYETIEASKVLAIKDAVKIGLLSKSSKNLKLSCGIDPYTPKITLKNMKNGNAMENTHESIAQKLKQLQKNCLKNFADKFVNTTIESTSSFVEIFGAKKRIVVKKTSLVWLLRNDSVKLSSDRLERVKCTLSVSALKKSRRKFKIRKVKPYAKLLTCKVIRR